MKFSSLLIAAGAFMAMMSVGEPRHHRDAPAPRKVRVQTTRGGRPVTDIVRAEIDSLSMVYGNFRGIPELRDIAERVDSLIVCREQLLASAPAETVAVVYHDLRDMTVQWLGIAEGRIMGPDVNTAAAMAVASIPRCRRGRE